MVVIEDDHRILEVDSLHDIVGRQHTGGSRTVDGPAVRTAHTIAAPERTGGDRDMVEIETLDVIA